MSIGIYKNEDIVKTQPNTNLILILILIATANPPPTHPHKLPVVVVVKSNSPASPRQTPPARASPR